MKKICSLLFALVAVTISHATQPTNGAPVSTEIILEDASPAIFPTSWVTGSAQASALPLAPERKETALRIIQEAMAAYPSAVLNENLKKVYVVGNLSFSGVAAGGTNSRSAIYLTFNERYSADEFRKNFHAEFSSILLRNYKRHFPETSWTLVNPEGFTYRRGGVQAIKDGQASLRMTDELFEQGLITEYSKASIQEDFNGFAARLLSGDARVWSGIERFPRMKAKADLTMQFFAAINPLFTPEHFASLRREEG